MFRHFFVLVPCLFCWSLWLFHPLGLHIRWLTALLFGVCCLLFLFLLWAHIWFGFVQVVLCSVFWLFLDFSLLHLCIVHIGLRLARLCHRLSVRLQISCMMFSTLLCIWLAAYFRATMWSTVSFPCIFIFAPFLCIVFFISHSCYINGVFSSL